MLAAKSESSRWRRLAFYIVVLELLAVVLFLVVLLIGERSRLTLISLYFPRQPLLVAVSAGGAIAWFCRRRRRELMVAHAVLALVILFPVMGLTLSTPRTLARPIHLASYNVFFGKLGRPQLIEEIVAMPADIILIEAAYDSLGTRLRERLPDRTIAQDAELIVISKFPLKALPPPSPLADGTPVLFAEYIVETPSGALRLFNVHPFSPRHALFEDEQTGDNIAHREEQIEHAVTAAKTDVPPFIIMGDTNLPVGSAIARRHFAGLTDAFSDVGFGFGYTFPAKRRWMRIDRCFGSDGVRFGEVRIAPLGTSDHRALYVDFELEEH